MKHLALLLIACCTLTLGCAAVQKGADQVAALTTQPAIQSIAHDVPGGSTALAIVGGLATLVGAIAGRFSASPTIAQHKTTTQALADFAQKVQTVAADPQTKQAIDEITAALPSAAKTAVAAAKG